MEYKVLLCLLLSVIVAYGDDKEEKVDAAVSLEDSSPFSPRKNTDLCYNSGRVFMA